VVIVIPNHTTYRAGQPVTLAQTATNRGAIAATVSTGVRMLSATVHGPAGKVWT